MTIARRANVALAVVFAIALTVAISVSVLAASAERDVSDYRGRMHLLQTAVWELRSDFYNYDDQMNMYVAVLLGGDTGNADLAETTFQQAAAARKQMAEDLAAARRLGSGAKLGELLARLGRDYDSYNGFADQVRAAAQQGDLKRAVYVMTVGNLEPSNDMMPTLDEVSALVDTEVTGSLATLQRHQATMYRLAVAFGGFVMLLVVLIAVALNLVILRPIGRLRDRMAGIASGAVGRQERLPATGQDELSRVAAAFNAMLDALAEQEAGLAREHAARDAETRANAEHARAGEASLRDRAQQAVADSSMQVRDELHQVMRDVEQVLAAAAAIDERVDAAGRRTTDAVRNAGDADRVVGQLGESLQRVSGITALIAGVADQTKLLALNATIEAARAGEAGRGFSVVADEVKQLAGTTTESTAEISSTITSLEANTAAMGGAIATVTAGIGGIDEVTSSLSAVADEQRRVVEALRNRVVATIERIESLADIGDRLERRRHPRAHLPVAAALGQGGQTFPADITDVSESGARCRTDTAGPRGGDVDLVLTVHGERLALPARIMRADLTPDGLELGIEFTGTGTAARGRLRDYVRELTEARGSDAVPH
nr:hypothetical protein GCM10020063_005000 [Dactylosporangium thailandense]